MQTPIDVVSRVDTSNGIGGTYSTAYGFGAKADLSGRGFLGFRQVPATNLQTNMVAMTNTRQDYPYIRLVASEVARATVFLTQSQASSFDLDGSALPTVTTSHQYDGVRQCHPDRGLGN